MDNPNIHVIYIAHNPETQGVEKDVREFGKDRMTETFVGLDIGMAEGQIGSYGGCSNGLSLPNSHLLYLDWEDLLTAAGRAEFINTTITG